jgi:uncharacterized membrane protein YqaE (UPF0057 family)
MILLAIFLPPVAVFLCGKPIQALLNIVLTLCAWLPGVIHAICVLNARNADKRTNKILDAMESSAGLEA